MKEVVKLTPHSVSECHSYIKLHRGALVFSFAEYRAVEVVREQRNGRLLVQTGNLCVKMSPKVCPCVPVT